MVGIDWDVPVGSDAGGADDDAAVTTVVVGVLLLLLLLAIMARSALIADSSAESLLVVEPEGGVVAGVYKIQSGNHSLVETPPILTSTLQEYWPHI
jgi:hypothetical protein